MIENVITSSEFCFRVSTSNVFPPIKCPLNRSTRSNWRCSHFESPLMATMSERGKWKALFALVFQHGASDEMWKISLLDRLAVYFSVRFLAIFFFCINLNSFAIARFPRLKNNENWWWYVPQGPGPMFRLFKGVNILLQQKCRKLDWGWKSIVWDTCTYVAEMVKKARVYWWIYLLRDNIVNEFMRRNIYLVIHSIYSVELYALFIRTDIF